MIRLPFLGWSFLFILLFPSWASGWVPLSAFNPRRALSNWILIEETSASASRTWTIINIGYRYSSIISIRKATEVYRNLLTTSITIKKLSTYSTPLILSPLVPILTLITFPIIGIKTSLA